MMGAELWALQTAREDVRRRLQRKIWALQRGPRPHCVLGITKYPSVNLFTAPLALTVSLPPVIHYSSCWIERWERKKLHLAHVKRAALQKNLHLSKTLFFFSKFQIPDGGYFLQFYHCKNVYVCACLCTWLFVSPCRRGHTLRALGTTSGSWVRKGRSATELLTSPGQRI